MQICVRLDIPLGGMVPESTLYEHYWIGQIQLLGSNVPCIYSLVETRIEFCAKTCGLIG